MSNLERRFQLLEEALKPGSKGCRILIAGLDGPRSDGLSEEEAGRKVTRLTQEGYKVTTIRFV